MGKKNFRGEKGSSSSLSYDSGDRFDKSLQRHGSGEFGLQYFLNLYPSTPPMTAAPKIPWSRFKAIEVLDALGSSMLNLNAGSGFVTGLASRGSRISILAFELANTIAKGSNLLQSLSEENIRSLKKDVLLSEGVQKLVSTNIKELLSIAAADKRHELDIFSREVIRFGDLCIDPQWHNLDRYISNVRLSQHIRLDTDNALHKKTRAKAKRTMQGLTRAEAEMTMQELTSLAQHTSELYHECNALDRFDQDYRQKLEEVEALNLPKRGENLNILLSQLKQQRKLVRSLKKKSLWSRILEEIMGKLVDIVTYMHQAISEAFGDSASVRKETTENSQKLGVAGLALHYANVIHQIDNIAARPASLPPNIRDTLYHGLPPSVKKALRSRLQSIDTKEKCSISQVMDEMEKTLQWLVPVATNTTKAHQCFGWVGEWANTGNEFGTSATTNITLTRLQTLYHADKQRTDACILELVAWLHHLISLVNQRDHSFEPQPGLSKSQELSLGKNKRIEVRVLSRGAGNSPDRSSSARKILNHPQTNILDVMDGLDLAT
ncbi:hypothetical protein REPUB_Repub19eG0016400 [Reevesia pubescens]